MDLLLNRHQRVAVARALFLIALVWQFNGVYMAALAKIGKAPFWIADFCQWIALPAILFILLAKKFDVKPVHYGFELATLAFPQQLFQALAVFLTTGLAFFGTRNAAWKLLGYPTGYFSFPNVFPDGLLGSLIWGYAAITAGVVESIFFIALPWLLYQNVRQNPSRIWFTLLFSAVFAMAHWEQGPHVVIGAYFSNLIACFWYFRTGSLWPVIGGHILVDLVAFA